MGVRLCEHKVKFILQNERDYDFPEFMKQIRTSLGRSRSLVSEDTKVSESQLYRIESGTFILSQKSNISILAKYYKVPKKVLLKKCEEYLAIKILKERGKIVSLGGESEICNTGATGKSNQA